MCGNENGQKLKEKRISFSVWKVSRKFYFQLLLVISNDINPFELLDKKVFYCDNKFSTEQFFSVIVLFIVF